MTTQTEMTRQKQLLAFYIFDTVQNGEETEYKRIGAVFLHKRGGGLNIVLDGKRLVAFPPKPKAGGEERQRSL